MRHNPDCTLNLGWPSCSCGMLDIVQWDDPDPDAAGGSIRNACSAEEAINRQLAHAEQMGRPYPKTGIAFADFADVLADFMLLHWAWSE